MINKIIKLQGHEKFALRDGWLNKGILKVADNKDAFVGKDGPDIFGMGNNMVKSLRYWLKAFDLTEDNGSSGVNLSEMARCIAEYDPYFEDMFTLWVLHSSIVRNESVATTWFMYFNYCDVNDVDKEQITKLLKREIIKYSGNDKFSENSLRSDVDVLLNMYSKTRLITDPEDKNVSPFARLDLIRNSDGKYSKNQPERRSINEWIVLYELSNLMVDVDNISIERVISGENGLANIYNMSAVVANEMLDRLDSIGYIKVDRTAGLDIIYRVKQFNNISVLNEYYRNYR